MTLSFAVVALWQLAWLPIRIRLGQTPGDLARHEPASLSFSSRPAPLHRLVSSLEPSFEVDRIPAPLPAGGAHPADLHATPPHFHAESGMVQPKEVGKEVSPAGGPVHPTPPQLV